jgi:hypothetical protein
VSFPLQGSISAPPGWNIAGFLLRCVAKPAARSFGRPQFLVHLLVCIAACAAGCLPQKISPQNAFSNRFRPKPIAPGPNGVFMDVIHLERPFGDSDLNSELWAKADEEQLGIALRAKLAARGFRVAVLGGALPSILKTLFNEEEIGQMNGEHLQLQHAMPTQVQTGGIHTAWPKDSPASGGTVASTGDEADTTPPIVLTGGSGTELQNVYVNAIGSLRVTPRINSEGGVDLVVVPEIQHGDARRHYVPSFGMNGPLDWSIQMARESRVFDDLCFTLRMRAGRYAIIGCLADDRTTDAAHFFSRQKDGQLMQRVVLIQAEPSQEAIAARSIRL